jgi:hypothetical protein
VPPSERSPSPRRLVILGADQLDGILPGGGGKGDGAARLHPLAGHVEVAQAGQRLGHALDHQRQGLFGQQPAAGGAHPVAGVALVAERRGFVGELDLAVDARVSLLEVVHDDLRDLALPAPMMMDIFGMEWLHVCVQSVYNMWCDKPLSSRQQRRGQELYPGWRLYKPLPGNPKNLGFAGARSLQRSKCVRQTNSPTQSSFGGIIGGFNAFTIDKGPQRRFDFEDILAGGASLSHANSDHIISVMY